MAGGNPAQPTRYFLRLVFALAFVALIPGWGRYLPRWQRLESVPRLEWVRRWGSPVLLLSWLPLIGDILCVAAGWLRIHWASAALFIAAGKFARYWIIALAIS